MSGMDGDRGDDTSVRSYVSNDTTSSRPHVVGFTNYYHGYVGWFIRASYTRSDPADFYILENNDRPTILNEEDLRDLSFGDDIVVDYEGINKINTGEGNDKVSTSDFKDFDIDGDGDYSDTMTDFIGFETDENPEI